MNKSRNREATSSRAMGEASPLATTASTEETGKLLNATPHEKSLAVGALLTFHRILREQSRQQLATKTGISISLLGMIENGLRLPTQETLERIGDELSLTVHQRFQLHGIAGYSAQIPEAPGWEVRAKDVLGGNFLFLRNMAFESKFQEYLDFDKVWIVTQRPMAMREPVLSMLRSKLLNTDAEYVYFTDRRFGMDDFSSLWKSLNIQDNPAWLEKQKARRDRNEPEQLAFVLSPPTLCAPSHTIAIFNPRRDQTTQSPARPRFGRTVYYEGGEPIGVYSMDPVLIEQLVVVLETVYRDCDKVSGIISSDRQPNQ